VVTPILTPYNNDKSIAEDLYLSHARWCLEQGSHYLSPFGTTGEALSNSMGERMAMVEQLVTSGVASADRFMPGTGLCSLEETLTLTRHAVELGCAAVMVLPPFFYVGVSDDGLFRYYSELIEAIGSNALKICLYNIPQNTGVAISPALSKRLNEAYPDQVVAYKDSSGNWENAKAVIAAAPGISVFPASESFLAEGVKLGAGGCISATCNTNGAAIRALYDDAIEGNFEEVARGEDKINQHRKAVQAAGLIPALKAMMAHASGDSRWLNLRAPNANGDPAIGSRLCEELGFTL
jgi:4-hydroxy-tetrahydrodipicolinate synthase